MELALRAGRISRSIEAARFERVGNDVSILLNQGHGTFDPQASYAVGEEPSAVAVGDVDGDCAPDIIVANWSSGDVSVLLNQGNGSFSPEARYAAGSTPTSIAIGDLDGDGALDLVVSNQTGGCSVLQNGGDGTFDTRISYAVGAGPSSVALGDLDRDGALDVVVANSFDDDVSVLLNQGDGSFEPGARYGAGNNPRCIAVGDLDRDGALDLVVANVESDDVSVLRNQGNGTFDPQRRYAVGDNPVYVAIGDLDGGGPEIAVANWSFDDVSVLRNLGNLTFDEEPNVAGDLSLFVAMEDLDGDRALDLVAVNRGGSSGGLLNFVSVAFNGCGSTSQASWHLDRIDQRSLPLDNAARFFGTGAGDDVYVVATGIRTTHSEFEGRASSLFDAVGGTVEDPNGWGTYIAGIAAGERYGVAPDARLHDVRVLNAFGSGSNSDIILGLRRVLERRPGVVVLPLGGGASLAMDDTVRTLSEAGFTVVVGAPTEGSHGSACGSSPSRAPEALTVGASDSMDRVASFSSQGACVDIFAPGVDVTGPWNESNSSTRTMSGTGQAAAVAAGAVAVRLSWGGSAPNCAAADIIENATAGALSGVNPDTPNLLLYLR